MAHAHAWGGEVASPDWPCVEVQATVLNYLEMLKTELGKFAYSKTAYRRRLLPVLNGRSEAAIERKHQNISAALIHLGFPYVDGYKPWSNY